MLRLSPRTPKVTLAVAADGRVCGIMADIGEALTSVNKVLSSPVTMGAVAAISAIPAVGEVVAPAYVAARAVSAVGANIHAVAKDKDRERKARELAERVTKATNKTLQERGVGIRVTRPQIVGAMRAYVRSQRKRATGERITPSRHLPPARPPVVQPSAQDDLEYLLESLYDADAGGVSVRIVDYDPEYLAPLLYPEVGCPC